MRLYFKAVKTYAGVIFRPDEDEKRESENSTFLKRYVNRTLDGLMIVDDAHGGYVECPMPKPFNLPGLVYWTLLDIWQTKIAKTHV